MSQVRRNVVANFMGKAWITLMNLAFIPLYMNLLGEEAYGLIGFNATLIAMYSLLDMGLTTTINREIAKWSAQPSEAQEVRNLVRTLEILYWGSAVLIGLITFAVAPFIAFHWLNVKHLPPETVLVAVRMMGVSIALQWPSSFYAGGLQGLQRQVKLNAVQVSAVTVRSGGAALAILLLAPTLQVFFGWYIFANALMTLLLGIALWRVLPRGTQAARFDSAILRRVGRFAAGMSGISLVSLVLMQMDKIVLSKALPLDQFGYYTLATTVAGVLLQVVGPFTTAVMPRLVQAASELDTAPLSRLYHRSCQAVAVAVAPLAMVIAAFSRELLLAWTGKAATAENTHLPLTLLAIGFGLNALMNMPYVLQLAHGLMRLAFWQNVVSILVLLPLLLFLVGRYGTTGAALVFPLLNLGYVLIAVPLMHARLLRGEQGRWYREDVLRPVCAALSVVCVGRLLLSAFWQVGNSLPSVVVLVILGVIWGLATLAAGVSAPQIRSELSQFFGGKQWVRQA